jgi:hypothetical protein
MWVIMKCTLWFFLLFYALESVLMLKTGDYDEFKDNIQMIMGKQRIFLSVFIVMAIFPSFVRAKSTCLDVIKWNGDHENVSLISEALRGGALLMQSSERCVHVTIGVKYHNKEWKISMIRNSKAVVYKGSNIQVITTWIESLLVPPKAIIMPKYSTSLKPSSAALAKKPGKSEKSSGISKKSNRASIPLLLGLQMGGGFSSLSDGNTSSLEMDLQLPGMFWTGVSASYFYAPYQDDIQRTSIFMEVLAGVKFKFKSLRFLPGISFGYATTELNKEGEIGQEIGVPLAVSQEDGFFSLFFRGEYQLSENIRLLAGFAIQYWFFTGNIVTTKESSGSSDVNNSPNNSSQKSNNDILRRDFPVSKYIFLFRIGIAWNFGGWQ